MRTGTLTNLGLVAGRARVQILKHSRVSSERRSLSARIRRQSVGVGRRRARSRCAVLAGDPGRPLDPRTSAGATCVVGWWALHSVRSISCLDGGGVSLPCWPQRARAPHLRARNARSEANRRMRPMPRAQARRSTRRRPPLQPAVPRPSRQGLRSRPRRRNWTRPRRPTGSAESFADGR